MFLAGNGAIYSGEQLEKACQRIAIGGVLISINISPGERMERKAKEKHSLISWNGKALGHVWPKFHNSSW